MLTDEDKINFVDFFLTKCEHIDVRLWIKSMEQAFHLQANYAKVSEWLDINNHIKLDLIDFKISVPQGGYFSAIIIENDSNGQSRNTYTISPEGVIALTPKVVEHFYNEKMNKIKKPLNTEKITTPYT